MKAALAEINHFFFWPTVLLVITVNQYYVSKTHYFR